MQPKSLSATAINVAQLCLARYKAEHIDRGRGFAGTAASLGTAVHGGLEMYVKSVYIEKKMEPSLKLLEDFFKMSYMSVFGSETTTVEYMEGLEMSRRWFKRTDFSEFKVISCEIKENFLIPTSIGNIPFNFIWDRHDQLDTNVYRVVDYKTNRWGLNPADLYKKVQARAYGVAAQIKYPNAERIWVQFDMLRHEGPVGVVFTRDDNIEMWRFLKREAQRIVDTPDDDVPETLNPECLFCPRVTTCGAVQKNLAVGGILSVAHPSEFVDLRAKLEWQKKAVSSALAKLDEVILGRAKVDEVFEYESDDNLVTIGMSSRRSVDAERVEHVIGTNLFERFANKSITMADIDKLLKGNQLSDVQKKQLTSLIYFKKGDPSVSVKPKNPID